MKFFKKRLSKKKLTKSLIETALTVPVINDSNKPLPPSPSTPLQSKPSGPSTKSAEPNSDSWLQLSLPNDFSSSFDMPQLQTEVLPSNKLEISSQVNSKTSDQQVENITENCPVSYPDNHIDTIACSEATPENTASATAPQTPPSFDSLIHEFSPVEQHESSTSSNPLHVEIQGETLNDTCGSSPILVNALSVQTDDIQHTEFVADDAHSLADVLTTETKESDENVQHPLPIQEAVAISPILPVEIVTLVVVAREDEKTDQPILELLKEQDEFPTPLNSLLENCSFVDQDPSDLLIAETPSTPSPIVTTVILPPLQAETEPLELIEERNILEVKSEDKEISKVAKRKSAISLIPRKQQLPIATEEIILQKPTIITTNKKDRRGSSSSFIPVPTRYNNNSTANKDVASWSLTYSSSSSDLSLERNSISSGSTSSYGSNHSQQDTKDQAGPSSIIKSNVIQQHSKIPKASFGLSLTNVISKSGTNPNAGNITTQQQQCASRLPTKRNSHIV